MSTAVCTCVGTIAWHRELIFRELLLKLNTRYGCITWLVSLLALGCENLTYPKCDLSLPPPWLACSHTMLYQDLMESQLRYTKSQLLWKWLWEGDWWKISIEAILPVLSQKDFRPQVTVHYRLAPKTGYQATLYPKLRFLWDQKGGRAEPQIHGRQHSTDRYKLIRQSITVICPVFEMDINRLTKALSAPVLHSCHHPPCCPPMVVAWAGGATWSSCTLGHMGSLGTLACRVLGCGTRAPSALSATRFCPPHHMGCTCSELNKGRDYLGIIK